MSIWGTLWSAARRGLVTRRAASARCWARSAGLCGRQVGRRGTWRSRARPLRPLGRVSISLHRRRDRARRQDGQGRRRRHHGRGQRLQGSVQGARGRDEATSPACSISPSRTSPATRPMPSSSPIMFKGNRKLLEDVLEGLFHIAKADAGAASARGAVPRPGRQALRHHRDRVRLHQGAPRRRRRSAILTTCWASSRRLSNEELKSHYRKLVAENHPDKLIARGVPKEFVAIATEKVAAINEAWDAVRRQRGLAP